MELDELQNVWIGLDKKIEENTRVNKELIRMLLLKKPQKRLGRLKFNSLAKLIMPFVILPIFFLTIEYRNDWVFYTGITLFLTLSIAGFIAEIFYFNRIKKIDFTGSLVKVSTKIAELKRTKLLHTRIRYLMSPLAILGVFMMAFKSVGHPHFPETYVLLFLIVTIFIASVVYTFRFAINEQFKKLNNEIDELRELGK